MNQPGDTAFETTPRSPEATSAAQSLPMPPLLDVISVHPVDGLIGDHFRADPIVEEPYSLYGGQVTAQALWAAGLTVPTGLHPHSLHAYFLRAGDTTQPVDFRVHRDRDGRRYSARRVVASQGGKPILTLSASFQTASTDRAVVDLQASGAPETEPPSEAEVFPLARLDLVEWRLPEPVVRQPIRRQPARLWARARDPLPQDRLVRACVLAYFSDASTGLYQLDEGGPGSAVTLDHAVWFHRDPRWDEFVLMDLIPLSISEGRGLYRGAIYAEDGRLLASLTQESLFPPRA